MIVQGGDDLRDAGRIVRHLLFNSLDVESLSIRGMERALGIPFSRLRRLLRWLQSEGVVVGYQVGTSMAFRVLDLERAVHLGLVSLSTEDLERAVYGSMALPASVRGMVRDDLTLKFLPASSDLPGPYLAAIGDLRRRWDLLYQAARRAFTGGDGERVGQTGRRGADGMEASLRLLGRDFVSKAGLIPLLYLVAVRQLKVPVEVELDEDDIEGMLHRLRVEAGVGEDEVRLLRYFPSLDPIALFARDVVMELGVPEEVSEEELRRAVSRVAEKYLRLLLKFSRGRHPSREARLVEALTLRHGALFGILTGAPADLVSECLSRASELEEGSNSGEGRLRSLGRCGDARAG